MSKELNKLKNQWQGYLIHINRHLSNIKQILPTDMSPESRDNLKIAVETLREYQSKIEELNSKILDEVEIDTDLEKEATKSA